MARVLLATEGVECGDGLGALLPGQVYSDCVFFELNLSQCELIKFSKQRNWYISWSTACCSTGKRYSQFKQLANSSESALSSNEAESLIVRRNDNRVEKAMSSDGFCEFIELVLWEVPALAVVGDEKGGKRD